MLDGMVGAEVGRVYVCDASVPVGVHELLVEVDCGAQIAAHTSHIFL